MLATSEQTTDTSATKAPSRRCQPRSVPAPRCSTRDTSSRRTTRGRRRGSRSQQGPDERLLHGLIAAAAATHHAGARNWSGAVGCAGNAVEYLDGVGSMPRGSTSNPSATGVAGSRPTRRRSSAQPHRRRIEGTALRFGDLDLPAALLAAPALAGAVTHGDEATFETAAELAREERGTGRTQFAELLFAFLREPDTRPQVAARFADHVELVQRKRRDVDDLF